MIQKGHLHERLPTSSDFDEFSKDGAEYQEELARRSAWTLHNEANTSAAKPIIQWKDGMEESFLLHKKETPSGKQRAVSSHTPKKRKFTSRTSAPTFTRGWWDIFSSYRLLDDFAVVRFALLRGNQETTLNVWNGEETVQCCTDNFVLLVAVTMQRATPSLDTIPTRHDPARVTLCHGKKWREPC